MYVILFGVVSRKIDREFVRHQVLNVPFLNYLVNFHIKLPLGSFLMDLSL